MEGKRREGKEEEEWGGEGGGGMGRAKEGHGHEAQNVPHCNILCQLRHQKRSIEYHEIGLVSLVHEGGLAEGMRHKVTEGLWFQVSYNRWACHAE